jgi:flotillin
MSVTGSIGVLITLSVVFFALFLVYLIVKMRYKKAGPDEALIVFGRRKFLGKKVRDESGAVESFRIVRGGGTFVWPGWESHEILSLKMMTLDIDLGHVYTVRGIPINVKAVAQVKVRGDVDHIRAASEGFLGMPVAQIQSTIKETLAGHLRGIIGTLTIEELYRDQKRFQDSVRLSRRPASLRPRPIATPRSRRRPRVSRKSRSVLVSTPRSPLPTGNWK